MTSASRERVQELFEAALKLPPEERASFLAEACGDDAELRAEVESLLDHDAKAGSDFMRPPEQGHPPMMTESSDDPDATRQALSPTGARSVVIEGYEIIREIQRGGQGVVYQAIQKYTKRKVAIKLLLAGPYASKAARTRFEREIELVAQLKHPNIITIFHSGQTSDDQQYCVMDYVHGVPLDQYVRNEKLTLEGALKLFAKVCDAVNYAHQKGVLHRDLKPSNILVDSDGEPRVLDFGLAKQLISREASLISLTGQVVGTLPYMSPEQAEGNPDKIDIRTDVYALGVILYQMLTGHYPYPVAGQMAEVLRHIAETPPTPPSRGWKNGSGVTQRTDKRIRPGQCPIDDEVQTIVLRTLAKERERRYQSAGELARDVAHYLADEPIEAKRDSGWYVLKKHMRHYRLPIGLASAFVVAITASLVVSVSLWRQAERDREAAVLAEQVQRHATAAAEDARAAEAKHRKLAEQRERLVRRNLYISDFNQAWQAITAGDARRCQSFLEPYATIADNEDFLSFEWHYLRGLLRPHSDMAKSLVKEARAAAFSVDGRYLALADQSGAIAILDTDTWSTTTTFHVNKNYVAHVAWSLDSKFILAIAQDHTIGGSLLGDLFCSDEVHVWDVESDRELIHLDSGQDCIWSGALSTSQNAILLGTDHAIQVVDMTTGNRVASLPDYLKVLSYTDPNLPIVVSPDDILAVGNTQIVLLAPRNKMEVRFDLLGLRLHSVPSCDWSVMREFACGVAEERVTALCWSPDGSALVTGGSVGSVGIVNLSDSDMWRKLGTHNGLVTTLAFSHDGRTITTGSKDTTVRVWDTTTGACTHVFVGHTAPIRAVTFSMTDESVVSVSANGSPRTWQLSGPSRPGAPEVLRGHTAPITDLRFSPDGKFLASCAAGAKPRTTTNPSEPEVFMGEVLVRSLDSGEVILRIPNDQTASASIEFTPDGKLLAVAGIGGEITVWNIATHSKEYALSGHREPVRIMRHSPDGRYWISGGGSSGIFTMSTSELKVWDTATRRHHADLVGHGHTPILGLLFSKDGRTLVSIGEDGTSIAWDMASMSESSRCSRGLLVPTLDGVVEIGWQDDVFTFRDPGNGKFTARRIVRKPTGLAFSSDQVSWAMTANNRVILVDLATGRTRLEFQLEPIDRSQFSPVVIWDLLSLEQLAFSEDGRSLAVGRIDGSICLWRSADQ